MVDALKTIELGDDDGHDVLVTSGLNGLAVEADERLACLDHIAHLDKAGKTLAVHFHGAQANMDEHAKAVLGNHADGVVGDGGGADAAVGGRIDGAGNGLDAIALAKHARGDRLVGNLVQVDEHAVDGGIDDAFAGSEACCGRNGRLAGRGEGGLKRIEQTHSCLQLK